MIVISDYLRRRGLAQSANFLSSEAQIDTISGFLSLGQQIPGLMSSPGGFLAEWFVIFWDLYINRITRQNHQINLAGLSQQKNGNLGGGKENNIMTRLMAAIGINPNRDASTLSLEENRQLNSLMNRYGNIQHLQSAQFVNQQTTKRRNPDEIETAMRYPKIPNIGQNQSITQKPITSLHTSSSSLGKNPKIQENPIFNPDDLMASLVQGNDTKTPSTTEQLTLKSEWGPFEDKATTCCVLEDLLLVGFRNGTLAIFDITNNKLVKREKIHIQAITQIKVHSRSTIIAGSLDKTVKLISLHDRGNTLKVEELYSHGGPVYSVEIIPGRDVIVSSDGDGVVKFWSLPTKSIIKELQVFIEYNEFLRWTQMHTQQGLLNAWEIYWSSMTEIL
jgi:hypothetical protein